MPLSLPIFYGRIEIPQGVLIPAARSVSVKTPLANCEPWSVLKMSGRPNRASASSKALMLDLNGTGPIFAFSRA